MREARGWPTPQRRIVQPGYADRNYSYMAFIATQNICQMQTAIKPSDEIINMPESGLAFNIAKDRLISRRAPTVR